MQHHCMQHYCVQGDCVNGDCVQGDCAIIFHGKAMEMLPVKVAFKARLHACCQQAGMVA